jgi:hypothetical protein
LKSCQSGNFSYQIDQYSDTARYACKGGKTRRERQSRKQAIGKDYHPNNLAGNAQVNVPRQCQKSKKFPRRARIVE